MARRRLSPPASALGAPETKSLRRPGAPSFAAPAAAEDGAPANAPIAGLAGEAARAGAEAARAAARLAEAEAEGRVLADIPLALIDDDFLARDRDPRGFDAAEMAALKASLRLHGQRTPAEVTRLEGRDLPWGLVSGHRRLAALRVLHAETGEGRFSRLRAVVRPRPPGSAAEAADDYVAMVEENEVRAGLSFYERGRIAVVAAERGAFANADEAIDALFAAAPRARRSKIRSFARIHREIGPLLRHPTRLTERLGLRVAEALKTGGAARKTLLEALEAAPGERSAEREAAILTAALAPPKKGVSRAKQAAAGEVRRQKLAPGAVLSVARTENGVRFELTGPAVNDAAVEAAENLFALLRAHFSGR